jgi:hypothetical protein
MPTLPHIGLAVKVQNCKNPNFVCFGEEVHAIRKAVHEGAANSKFQSWKLHWTLRDSLEDQVEFIKESCAQPGLLVLIPQGRCLDIKVRLRADNYAPCHQSDQRSRSFFSMSLRISSQVRPAVGFAL